MAASYQLSSKGIEMFDTWANNRPASQVAYRDQIVKSYATIALANLAAIVPCPKLRVQVKPHKAVYSQVQIPAGKLVIVPETSRIALLAAGADQPPAGLLCKAPAELTEKMLFLLPQFGDSFASPAWAIRVTEDEATANTEVVFKQSSIVVSQKLGKGSAKPPSDTVAIESER